METLKKLIPAKWLNWLRPYYHGFLGWAAGLYYGQPSEALIVVGVTGTVGKSTTVALLARILNFNGHLTGYITTVDFFDGKTQFMNKRGLSMSNEITLQKQLQVMAARGCKYAIVECTSEGLAQNRHAGINFDVALFTNLSHAHVEAHGSYGNYQAAKGRLFAALSAHRRKIFFPQKMLGVNFDDPISGYFLSFAADKKFGVSFKNVQVADAQKVFHASPKAAEQPIEFSLDNTPMSLNLLGEFNVKNAALAAACANMLGVGLEEAAAALKDFRGVRGRMEQVANRLGLKIIVDYGCEPESFKSAAEAAAQLSHQRLIHVFGTTGGHRDKQKRFEFGKISAQYADYIIITNDDVYDSDPQEIANKTEIGIQSFKLRKPQYEIILDRRAAIARALALAQKGDLVLITGKGSEQFLVLPGNKRIEWDEVAVVEQELAKISLSSL